MYLFPLVAILLTGCASRPAKPEVTPVTEIPLSDGWYCQPGLTPGSWDCVQDGRLAKNPPPPRPLPAPVAAEPEPAPALEAEPMPLMPEIAPVVTEPQADDASDEPLQRRLDDLPPDRYTIQLIAMDTRRALEPFLTREDLGEAFIARVERDGALYYVLLTGVYETEMQARQAANALADDLKVLSPWVRSVRGLQAAHNRARQMAALDPA